jgi:hypothetical protein
MATQQTLSPVRNSYANEVQSEATYEKWVHWPVNWSAVGVGALAALAAVLMFGLIGLALGAHVIGPENRVVDLKKLSIGALVFSVGGAFFAFVIGGWVAGKIAGILHSEPAMLHGAIVWLATLPALVVLAAFGAGNYFGGWYAGLAGAPSWAAAPALPFEKPEATGPDATAQERADARTAMEDYHQKVKQWHADTPKVVRNTALGAVTAVLLGLIGGVIGGWLACGEPMNFTHYRTRRSLLAHNGRP